MLPQRKAALLGEALNGLSNDDGPQLSRLLWQLRHEVKNDPADLMAATALNHALALAGLTGEARTAALRSLTMLRSVPIVPVDIHLNVVAVIADAGFATDARRCLENLDARDMDADARARHRGLALDLALRYGDLTWLSSRLPEALEVSHLQRHRLVDWWPRHQQQVEAAIGPRVASFRFEMVGFEDGSARLVLDYFTDATSYAEVEQLDAGLWRALSPLHEQHPDGPGMLLGAVLLSVHGPQIPLEDLTP